MIESHTPNNDKTSGSPEVSGPSIEIDYKALKESSISPDDIQRLRELGSTTEPEAREALEDLLDDRSYNLARHLYGEEIDRNRSIIHNRRSSKKLQEEARDKQKELLAQAKQQLLEFLRINPESAKGDTEVARDRIQHILLEAKEREGENFDPLDTLGIVTVNDDGEKVFNYPNKIFPKSTNEKWTRYITAVRHHIDIARKIGMGLSTQAEVVEADRTRRLAHDIVSRDVQEILNLSGKDWDFEETRKLVAKMRENRLPNITTSEEKRTAQALEEGMRVVDALRNNLLPPDKTFWEPKSNSDY